MSARVAVWPSIDGLDGARQPLEGRHPPANAVGTAGAPRAVDDDVIAYARTLRAGGVPVPQIACKLVIPSGKNKGEHTSVATAHRVLAEAGATDPTS
ncbi:hypothetical protein ACFWFF_34865 [Streptomyces sp. NPDC060223]|uniref:hypothetical protein n=1 Tax=unclassified Streptomyces TaxID=2593676 RepID=UPI00363D4240